MTTDRDRVEPDAWTIVDEGWGRAAVPRHLVDNGFAEAAAEPASAVDLFGWSAAGGSP